MDINQTEVEKYGSNYSEDGLWDKITGTAKKAGSNLIYEVLQLFYVAQNPNVPMKIRAAMVAPLGYFISPVDLIPDLAPVVGYTDDAAVIAMAIAFAHAYIDDDIRRKAKDKLVTFFGKGILKNLS
ncbi:MAG: DUF1232 domain-containing protein [Selenomonadaceae bacterium]|nr:DUF1232 domain-containing protein [Selenomonadaceae bacterium]